MDWDEIFEDERFTKLEPAEEVLDFLGDLAAVEAHQVLDHGCGAGRHMVMLAAAGYAMTGVDISPRGCEITRESLRRDGLPGRVDLADMRALPYPDQSFDAVLSRGVITHGECSDVLLALSEIARVTRPGGLLLCTFLSQRSSMFGKGTRIDAQTWICDDPLEAGVTHYFMTRDDVLAATTDIYQTIRLNHLEHGGVVDSSRPYVSAHWIFVGCRVDRDR